MILHFCELREVMILLKLPNGCDTMSVFNLHSDMWLRYLALNNAACSSPLKPPVSLPANPPPTLKLLVCAAFGEIESHILHPALFFFLSSQPSSSSSSSAEPATPLPHLSRPESPPISSPARPLAAAQRKPSCSPPPLPRCLSTPR